MSICAIFSDFTGLFSSYACVCLLLFLCLRLCLCIFSSFHRALFIICRALFIIRRALFHEMQSSFSQWILGRDRIIFTDDPTWSDIFECCFKAQSSMLEGLFSLKHGNGDVRALSFELSKMTPQVGLAVYRVTSKKM